MIKAKMQNASNVQAVLPALVPQVCQLAHKAGLEVLRIYMESANGDLAVHHKSDASPLTAADLAAHACIVDGLQALTPDVTVVSEEGATRLLAGQSDAVFWLVDPLDGTKEFLERNGQFTVNIALVVQGRPVWGVVYAPVPDQMYWGGAGMGAFRRQVGQLDRLTVSGQVQHGQPWRVVASKSHLNNETRAFIDRLGRAELVQAGSSLKFCRVAEGAADIYPRLAPTCEWDTAAAQAVLEGAGGHVVDLQGQPLRYGKPDVLNPHFVACPLPWAALEPLLD